MSADVVEKSEALHVAVRAFAHRAFDSPGEARREFDALALQIAAFQAEHCAPFRRLVQAHRASLQDVAAIPALPADVFRLTRVATHPAALDVACFRTSGTTATRSGVHPFRTLITYRELSVAFARKALAPRGPRCTVVALAPPFATTPQSSLGAMMQFFIEAFDGRPLPGENAETPVARSTARWLLSSNGVDVAGLRSAVEAALRREEPLLLLATSLALSALLEALGGERLELPAGSVVMPTGGAKGRVRTFQPERLHAQVVAALLPESGSMIGEYGMTELSSQLYAEPGSASPLYREPPWLRVSPVDPITLEELGDGEVGLARFVDLGNVDSAVALLTQDLIRREAGGVRLLGRQEGAGLRGCSLSIESVLAPALGAPGV